MDDVQKEIKNRLPKQSGSELCGPRHFLREIISIIFRKMEQKLIPSHGLIYSKTDDGIFSELCGVVKLGYLVAVIKSGF